MTHGTGVGVWVDSYRKARLTSGAALPFPPTQYSFPSEVLTFRYELPLFLFQKPSRTRICPLAAIRFVPASVLGSRRSLTPLSRMTMTLTYASLGKYFTVPTFSPLPLGILTTSPVSQAGQASGGGWKVGVDGVEVKKSNRTVSVGEGVAVVGRGVSDGVGVEVGGGSAAAV